MTPMPYPRYEDLREALAEVRDRAAVLEAAMDSAHRQFTTRAVWVGPAARSFAEELSARRARLRETAQLIVDELEEEARARAQRIG